MPYDDAPYYNNFHHNPSQHDFHHVANHNLALRLQRTRAMVDGAAEDMVLPAPQSWMPHDDAPSHNTARHNSSQHEFHHHADHDLAL